MAFNCGEDPDLLRAKWSERNLRALGILHAHEPPLEERLDFWMPQVVAACINPWRKKGSPAVMPKDLAPEWWPKPVRAKSNAQWRDILRGMTLAFGGSVK